MPRAVTAIGLTSMRMNRRIVATILLLTSMWVLYRAGDLVWFYGEADFSGSRWTASTLRDFVTLIELLMGVLRPFALIACAATVVTTWVPALARGQVAAANTAVLSALLVVVPAFVVRVTSEVRDLGLESGSAWSHVYLAALLGFVGALMLRRTDA
jgi:hypothetical protein